MSEGQLAAQLEMFLAEMFRPETMVEFPPRLDRNQSEAALGSVTGDLLVLWPVMRCATWALRWCLPAILGHQDLLFCVDRAAPDAQARNCVQDQWPVVVHGRKLGKKALKQIQRSSVSL